MGRLEEIKERTQSALPFDARFTAHAHMDIAWLLERLEKAEHVLELAYDSLEADQAIACHAITHFLASLSLTPKPKDASDKP